MPGKSIKVKTQRLHSFKVKKSTAKIIKKFFRKAHGKIKKKNK